MRFRNVMPACVIRPNQGPSLPGLSCHVRNLRDASSPIWVELGDASNGTYDFRDSSRHSQRQFQPKTFVAMCELVEWLKLFGLNYGLRVLFAGEIGALYLFAHIIKVRFILLYLILSGLT